jgi:hypothetical protein
VPCWGILWTISYCNCKPLYGNLKGRIGASPSVIKEKRKKKKEKEKKWMEQK